MIAFYKFLSVYLPIVGVGPGVELGIRFRIEARDVGAEKPLLSIGALGRIMASLLAAGFIERFQ